MLVIEKFFLFLILYFFFFFLSVHIPLPWPVYFFNYFSQELCRVPYHILALVHSAAPRISAVQLLALVYQTDTSVRMSAQLLNAVVVKATNTSWCQFALGATKLYAGI